MIVIVNYGLGNLGSIANMFKKIGVAATISSEFETIGKATKLILPGVGAFDHGMNNLNQLGIREILQKKVLREKTPILGICLGFQLMAKSSEEGKVPGLGWLDAEAARFHFPENQRLKIPHMGWNTVRPRKESRLFRHLEDQARFYFVHSYHIKCADSNAVLSETTYGYDFISAMEVENICGVQFHPEKSHKYGMQLLKNFAE